MLNYIHSLKSRLLTGSGLAQDQANILDQYVTSSPGPQNALNIFKGEWSSKFPGYLANMDAGTIPLFEDDRIDWAITQLGSIEGKTVLELGPLEGGHTYMLEKMGVSQVIAIEANTRAYLKCLIAKELLHLKRARFLCGDFVEYLRQNQTTFDICIACGVLYHMRNPIELIELLSKVSGNLFVWTHYYDQAIISTNPRLAHKFPGSSLAEHSGFKHTLYRQEYKDGLNTPGFCGGSDIISHWLSREEIIAALRYFGFDDIRIGFDEPNHPNGPAFALVAKCEQ